MNSSGLYISPSCSGLRGFCFRMRGFQVAVIRWLHAGLQHVSPKRGQAGGDLALDISSNARAVD